MGGAVNYGDLISEINDKNSSLATIFNNIKSIELKKDKYIAISQIINTYINYYNEAEKLAKHIDGKTFEEDIKKITVGLSIIIKYIRDNSLNSRINYKNILDRIFIGQNQNNESIILLELIKNLIQNVNIDLFNDILTYDIKIRENILNLLNSDNIQNYIKFEQFGKSYKQEKEYIIGLIDILNTDIKDEYAKISKRREKEEEKQTKVIPTIIEPSQLERAHSVSEPNLSTMEHNTNPTPKKGLFRKIIKSLSPSPKSPRSSQSSSQSSSPRSSHDIERSEWIGNPDDDDDDDDDLITLPSRIPSPKPNASRDSLLVPSGNPSPRPTDSRDSLLVPSGNPSPRPNAGRDSGRKSESQQRRLTPVEQVRKEQLVWREQYDAIRP
jgi:hypothetical protein